LYPFFSNSFAAAAAAAASLALRRRVFTQGTMEEYGGGDLLSEAMGSAARVVVVEDCVEAPGAFVLHLLLKRALAGGGAAAFLALAQPFTHYDRILRKMVRFTPSTPRMHFVEHVLC
jgi:hypothetical protein